VFSKEAYNTKNEKKLDPFPSDIIMPPHRELVDIKRGILSLPTNFFLPRIISL